jgi:ribonuclease E
MQTGGEASAESESDSERRRRRRGRRGGRRNRRDRENGSDTAQAADAIETPSADSDMDAEMPPERDIVESTYAPRMDEPTTARMDLSAQFVDNNTRINSPQSDVLQGGTPENAFTPWAEQGLGQMPEVEASPRPVSPPAVAEETKPAEPPRRRSTIREPAPMIGEAPVAIPAPAPTPVPAVVISHEPAPSPAAPEESDAGKPRRTGWWARRFAGDKG